MSDYNNAAQASSKMAEPMEEYIKRKSQKMTKDEVLSFVIKYCSILEQSAGACPSDLSVNSDGNPELTDPFDITVRYSSVDPQETIQQAARVMNYLLTGSEYTQWSEYDPLGGIITKALSPTADYQYRDITHFCNALLMEQNRIAKSSTGEGRANPYRDATEYINYPNHGSASGTGRKGYHSTAEPSGFAYGYKQGESSSDERRSMALPGFRTNVLWKKIAAIMGYIIMLGFSYEYGITAANPSGHFLVHTLFALISSVGSALWFFDYRGCKCIFPGMKKKGFLRGILSIVYWLVFFTFLLLIYSFLIQ